MRESSNGLPTTNYNPTDTSGLQTPNGTNNLSTFLGDQSLLDQSGTNDNELEISLDGENETYGNSPEAI